MLILFFCKNTNEPTIRIIIVIRVVLFRYKAAYMQHKSPFLQSIESMMRVERYSKRTIKSYLYWIKYFILFHHKQHRSKLGEINGFRHD